MKIFLVKVEPKRRKATLCFCLPLPSFFGYVKMGCFNTFCCVTDLPICYQEPVAFGLIAKTRDSRFDRDGQTESTCGHYGFVTPIFKSFYNDYGSVEYKEISPKPLWNNIWSSISSKLKKGERFNSYSRNKDENNFHNLIYGDTQFFIEDRNFGDNLKNCYIWICHEWAFDELLKFEDSFDEKLKEQVENYLMKGYVPEDIAEPYFLGLRKYEKDSEEQKIAFENYSKWKIKTDNCLRIEGDQGVFPHWVRFYLHRGHDSFFEWTEPFRDDYRKELYTTSCFVHRLKSIGRGVLPPLFHAGQENSQNALLWNKLVAQKTQDREEKWKNE